jgi:hypothetical protein
MLIQAVKNSRKKLYHGDDENEEVKNKLPSLAE